MKKKFTVTLDIPEGASVTDTKQYIYDAVTGWAGSLRPPGGYGEADEGDPLFGLNRGKVKVAIANKSRGTK